VEVAEGGHHQVILLVVMVEELVGLVSGQDLGLLEVLTTVVLVELVVVMGVEMAQGHIPLVLEVRVTIPEPVSQLLLVRQLMGQLVMLQ
jgi:hypothetical protein